MSSERERLPNRRGSENFAFVCGGLPYVCTFSRFSNGNISEIFISNHKSGSDADTAARDSAVAASLGFQFGVPLDVLRRALLRDARGKASSPLGQALDIVAEGL